MNKNTVERLKKPYFILKLRSSFNWILKENMKLVGQTISDDVAIMGKNVLIKDCKFHEQKGNN